MTPIVAPVWRRARFFGTEVDLLSRKQTVERILAAIEEGRPIQHCVINVAKLVTMQKDASLRHDVDSSDIVNADGMGVVWGARLLGVRIPERVAGIDLFQDLLQACAERGFKPYLLGARQDVLEAAVRAIEVRFPGIQIAGFRNGYFTRADEPRIVAEIKESHADMLFVAISSPVKERFIAEHRENLGVPFMMGVGGSIDVIAGHIERAPEWMQRYGLEWLFRVIQEPRRMWKRYLVTNTVFAGLLAREIAVRTVRRLLPHGSSPGRRG